MYDNTTIKNIYEKVVQRSKKTLLKFRNYCTLSLKDTRVMLYSYYHSLNFIQKDVWWYNISYFFDWVSAHTKKNKMWLSFLHEVNALIRNFPSFFFFLSRLMWFVFHKNRSLGALSSLTVKSFFLSGVIYIKIHKGDVCRNFVVRFYVIVGMSKKHENMDI